jgi:MFS family permease
MTYPTAAAEPPQRVLMHFAPAVLVIFFGYMTFTLPLAALPLQIHDRLGYGSLIVGITIGIQSLVTLVTRQFAGGLCDKKGAKLVVLLGGGWSLAAALIYLFSCVAPLSDHFLLMAILIARAALGIGESLVMTGSLTWAVGAAGPRHTGIVMVWIGIAMYGAVAAGAPLGLWLVMQTTAGGGFAAVALAAIVCALAATVTGLTLAPIAPHGGERLPFMAVAARIAPFGAGLSLATLGFGAIAAFAALDFQTKGWPGAGLALAGFGAAYIVTRVLFGHWPDRFGGARIALISLVIEACGQALLWFAPAPAGAIAGAILTGAGFSLVFPSFGIEAVRHVSAANRGSALGAYAAFFDLGFALSGPVTGLFAGTFGYSSAFAVGTVSAIIAVVSAIYAANKTSAVAAV